MPACASTHVCQCQGVTTSGNTADFTLNLSDSRTITRNELHVTSNRSGSIRREKHGGRDYFIVPMTMIVSGVLNGSRGPLYYPPEEVGRNPKIWDGMPILVYHPKNGRSGRDPLVANEQEIGRVYNTRYANNKLSAEGWFDVELTKRVDNRVYESLVSNKRIELSTGLYADYDDTPGDYNGIQYTTVVRNIGADHLAILPDQIGACSLKDGCGVMNQRTKPLMQRLKEFLHLVENEETTESDETENSFPGHKGRPGQRGGSAPRSGGGGGSSESQKDELIDPDSVSDNTSYGYYGTHQDAAIGDNPSDKTYEDAATTAAANFKAMHSRLKKLGMKARTARDFLDSRYGRYMADLELSGKLTDADINKYRGYYQKERDKEAQREGYGRVSNELNDDGSDSQDDLSGSSTTNEGEPVMAKLTDVERKDRIDKLVANAAWKDHRKVLEGFKDEQLLTLNCGDMMPKATDSPPPDDTEEDEEEVPPKAPVQNKGKLSFSEIMEIAPPEFKNWVNNGLRREAAEKAELIKSITENEDCEYTENELKEMSPELLKKTAKLATNRAKVQSHQDFHSYASYIGAAGAPIENSREKTPDAEKKKGIPRQTINYAKLSPLVANAARNGKPVTK